jgi:hypothetical protein
MLPPNNSDFSSADDMAATLDDLLGTGNLFAMFSSILGNVTAVEGMIEAFIRRYPERADVLWDTFMTVRPHAALQVEDSVWQHHVHELLTRVVHGLDLQAPTTAELAAWILGTMLSEGEDVAGITTPDENGDMLGLAYVMGRVSQQPPYVIRNLLEHAPRMEDRHQPDPRRWYERVPLERKRDIVGAANVPAEMMVPASWEVDDIMEAV